jgi:hypothetical protein
MLLHTCVIGKCIKHPHGLSAVHLREHHSQMIKWHQHKRRADFSDAVSIFLND